MLRGPLPAAEGGLRLRAEGDAAVSDMAGVYAVAFYEHYTSRGAGCAGQPSGGGGPVACNTGYTLVLVVSGS